MCSCGGRSDHLVRIDGTAGGGYLVACTLCRKDWTTSAAWPADLPVWPVHWAHLTLPERVALVLCDLRASADLPRTDVSRDSGLSTYTIKMLEECKSRNVDLRHLYILCRTYGVHLLDVVQGVRSPRPWPAGWASCEGLDLLVRARMKARRIHLGVGAHDAATRIQAYNTWVLRIESGEVATLDLRKLDLLATLYETTLLAWLDPGATEEGATDA